MAKKEFKKEDEKREASKSNFKAGKSRNKRFIGKDKDVEKVARRNDAAWYTKYGDLAENAGRVAFNHRNGEELFIDADDSGFRPVEVVNQDPVLVINTILTPGVSDDNTSAINVMSGAMYKALNRKYRGSQSSHYQQSDVGIIEFGLIDLFTSISEAERVYALLLKYQLNQKSMPKAMLVAMGIDYTSFEGRLADYRLSLNEMIMTAKGLCLVRGHTLLDHSIFLYSNLFKDKDTERANYFAYVKAGYWKFNPTAFKTGSALEFVPYTASRLGAITVGGQVPPTEMTEYNFRTMDDILKDISDQLNSFTNDDDVDKVCSDILAWFGNEDNSPDVVKLGWIPEELDVNVIYNEDVMKQLHNTTCFSSVDTSIFANDMVEDQAIFGTDYPADIYADEVVPSVPQLFIFQNHNNIYFNMHICDGGTYVSNLTNKGIHQVFNAGSIAPGMGYTLSTPVVDTDKLNPDVAHVFEITRQCVAAKFETATVSGSARGRTTLTTFGSIVACNFRFYVPFQPGYAGYRLSFEVSGVTYDILAFEKSDCLMYIAHSFNTTRELTYLITKYDWAPLLYYLIQRPGSSKYIPLILGDLDNYKPMTVDVLSKIHKVALQSELHNPISDILIKE